LKERSEHHQQIELFEPPPQRKARKSLRSSTRLTICSTAQETPTYKIAMASPPAPPKEPESTRARQLDVGGEESQSQQRRVSPKTCSSPHQPRTRLADPPQQAEALTSMHTYSPTTRNPSQLSHQQEPSKPVQQASRGDTLVTPHPSTGRSTDSTHQRITTYSFTLSPPKPTTTPNAPILTRPRSPLRLHPLCDHAPY
jgi:hypothetical protein